MLLVGALVLAWLAIAVAVVALLGLSSLHLWENGRLLLTCPM